MADYLTRDQILAAPDLVFQDVPVPEWGGTVRVRGMTGLERDAWEAAIIASGEDEGRGRKRKANIRATMCAACIVDANGSPVFTAADIDVLGQKSVRALQRVYDVAQRLSSVTRADLKELEGNSDAGRGDASPSR